jgi:hypothetical protein
MSSVLKLLTKEKPKVLLEKKPRIDEMLCISPCDARYSKTLWADFRGGVGQLD